MKLSAAGLVGVGWLSPWQAPAQPVAATGTDVVRTAAAGPLVVATAEPATAEPAAATTVPAPVPRPSRPARQATRPSRAATKPRPADVWLALARCESGANPTAVSADGRYLGAFQFDLPSWQRVGMTGSPIDHPYDVQLGAARRLHALQGWSAWPTCARRLGLIP